MEEFNEIAKTYQPPYIPARIRMKGFSFPHSNVRSGVMLGLSS